MKDEATSNDTEVPVMPAPDPGRVPDVVPADWVAAYRDERAGRRLLLAAELDRLERASGRDTSLLLVAGWFCLLLLVVVLGWVGTSASAGMWLGAVAVFSAFATCLWVVLRGQGSGDG